MPFSDVVSDVDNFTKNYFQMLMTWPNMVVNHTNNKMHFPGLVLSMLLLISACFKPLHTIR